MPESTPLETLEALGAKESECQTLASEVLRMGGVQEITEARPFDRYVYGLRLVADGASRASLDTALEDLEPSRDSKRVLACQGRALFSAGRWTDIHFVLDAALDGTQVVVYREL